MTAGDQEATVNLRVDVLDQVVKSLMQSVSANSNKRRRLSATTGTRTQTYRDATIEGDLLDEALSALRAAQRQSLDGDIE